jgi:hypothetical protein
MAGKPEQDMLSNLLARTSDVMLEYIVSNRTQSLGWRRPLFDLGPERLITVVFSSLVETLYVFQDSLKHRNALALDGKRQQEVIRRLSTDVIFAAKYYSSIDSNRGAWVMANRILNGGWTKRNIQKFIKSHRHSEVRMTNEDRNYFGLHMLTILEKAGIIVTKDIGGYNPYKGQINEQKYVYFTEEIKDALVQGHNHHIVNSRLRYMPMAVPPIRHSMTTIM